jgi:hypothetical protein
MLKSSSTDNGRAFAWRRSYALILVLVFAAGCAIFFITRADAQNKRSRKQAAQQGTDRPNVRTTAPSPNKKVRVRPQDIADGKVRVRTADKFDVSPPLRSLKPIVTLSEEKGDDDPGLPGPVNDTRHDPDPVVQSSMGHGVFNSINVTAIPAAGASFDGLFNPAPSPFNTGPVPPDPNGDIGPNHYVQMVNTQFQIFTRAGASVFGPANINTLFTGFGGPCQTENAGDPVVLYDQLADRWLLSQFTSAGPTYFNCVAISTTGDPTGTYYRYAIATGGSSANFTDYPKYGIWPDAYYISTREFFQNTTFSGNGAYALERAEMIKGNPSARVVSVILPPGGANDYRNGDGWLPSDLDGYKLPPAGSPNYFVGSMDNGGPYGAPADALNLFEFHVDWTTPLLSTFTFTSQLNTAAFDSIFPCAGGSTPSRNCIPQPGTTTKIDILSYRQRPTFRLAYRNFGTHESLVTAQSVEASTGLAGMRWWEIRSPHSSPAIFQEGTYAPDTVNRWMGSIAMDHDGNAGLAYSVSDAASVFPGIRYTGRLSTDTLGQMPQGEATLVSGSGSQTSTSSRWGDYSSMNIDPNNDCNFWYTNEYYTITAARPWKTRYGFFRFPQCNVPAGSVISAGQLIISEFRLRGPGGSMDEFIELYNTLDTNLSVKTADGTGLAVVSSDAPTLAKCVVPEGYLIPARGHFLCADTASPSPGAAAAYSLSAYPSGNDGVSATTAAPNANILSDIPDAAGLALFASTTAANFTMANRLDAVGDASLPPGSLFKEGNGITSISATTPSGQYAFVRKQPGGVSQDSGANENDFRFIDPALESFGATPQLGAAGPENLDSPVFGTGTISNSRVDGGVCFSCGENAVRDHTAGDPLTSSQGTVDLRIKVTNNTGVDLTRLRFRIFEITTTPEAGVADVRAISSGPITVPITGGGMANVEGTTLETPPTQSNGGGYNATLSLASVVPGTPFLNGASKNVRFLLGVKTTGIFRFAVAFEGLPKGGNAVSGGVYGLSRDTENLAGGPTAATAYISGSVNTPNGVPVAGVAMRLSGQKSATSITDSNGNYRFDNVDTNNLYTITPSLANYRISPTSRSFSLLANKSDAVFTATPEAVVTTNAIDMSEYFVRQQYLDFLGREPDAGGLEYWTSQIAQCGEDVACTNARRIGVSAAFFKEKEYQETGSYVYRLYKGALGRQVRFAEFSTDRQQVVGGTNLEQDKAAFADAFVQRPEFAQKYGAKTTAESFIDALVQTVQQSSGADLSNQRGALIATYNAGSNINESRSLAVRAAIDDASFKSAEYNRSFVQMQYFGYLKRDPEQAGFDFWLNVLNNKEPGNYRGMVCSFITSAEYQQRFSPAVTHSNRECGH